jgi:hypothetical protein
MDSMLKFNDRMLNKSAPSFAFILDVLNIDETAEMMELMEEFGLCNRKSCHPDISVMQLSGGQTSEPADA